MLVSAIPVLQALNIDDTITFYEKKLGFTKLHQEEGFAIVYRDAVHIHFTQCSDTYLPENTACRINVTDVESLYQEYKPKGVLRPDAHVETTWWGTKDLHLIDLNGNLITFTEPVSE